MAISSVNTQTVAPVQMPGQGARDDKKLTDDAATARATAPGSDTSLIAAADKRNAAVNIQKGSNNTDENKSDKTREPDAKSVHDAVNRLQDFVQSATSDVQFSVDEKSGIRIVSVVDKATKEVIRQMPSKEAVELARALDKLQGLIIKQTA
ncbi:MAG: flagellar protein FlaG [Bacteroidota bacterium]